MMNFSRSQLAFVACVFTLGLMAASTGSARVLQQSPSTTQTGVTVSVVPGASPYNLTVFNIPSTTQCVFQGYPGSRGDSVVPGPLTFSIPPSIVAIRAYFQTTNAALVVYNNSIEVVVQNSTASGLSFADYYKTASLNSSGTLYGGLIPNYNPNDPAHNAASPPACYYNVSFVTAATAPAPAPAGLPILG